MCRVVNGDVAGEGAGTVKFCRADQGVVVGIGADLNSQTDTCVGRRGGVERGRILRLGICCNVTGIVCVIDRNELRLPFGRLGECGINVAVGNVGCC